MKNHHHHDILSHYEQQRQAGVKKSRLADKDDEDDIDGTTDARKGYTGKAEATSSAYVSRMTGLDPMDEFLDGTFQSAKQTGNKKANQTTSEAPAAPKCARHQRPCKLIVVKKNATGNKGRKFYACSMPRGEQCNHFQWADDTVEVS